MSKKTVKKASKKKGSKWAPKKVNFSTDLTFGKQGQDRLLKRADGVLAQLEGRKNDFVVVKSGKKLELKTENYKLNARQKFSREQRRTPNMFIERWSDEKRNKAGGPFQALANGSEFYAHLYNNDKLVIFKTKKLVEKLNKMDFTMKYKKNKKSIFNPAGAKSWVTVGYSIPFSDLEDVAEVVDCKASEIKKAFSSKKTK